MRWSIAEPEAFWREVWHDAGIVGDAGSRTLIDANKMPGARWFPDARLNFAENLLARRPRGPGRRRAGVLGRRQGQAARLQRRPRRGGVPRRAADARGGRPTRRPRRRIHPEPARGDHRHARRRQRRRDLVVGIAGFRRAGRARPLRPDRARVAVHCRWLLVQRQAAADPRQARRDRQAPADVCAGWW